MSDVPTRSVPRAGARDPVADRPRPTAAAALHIGVRRVATAAEAAAVAGVLAAAAVAASPVAVLLGADHDARRAALRRGLAVLAGWAIIHGAVDVHASGAGAAIWLPADLDAEDAIDDAVLEAGANTLATAALGVSRRPSIAAATAAGPAAYLLAVGTVPGHRRRGVARQVLDAYHAGLDAAHAAGWAAATDLAGHRLLTAAGYRPDHVDQAAPGLALQWLRRLPGTGRDGAAW
ncbi:hypothetical protein [Dactylosporangium sp. CA-092794]|uniref:hypothetical protein n=1 Tax=Dactylosporangium sp. CA-092794 TaxID=3239929 RepID=UPI003D89F983